MNNGGDEIENWTGSIADVPQDVLDGIVRDQLGIFSVGLLGVDYEAGQPSLKLCGSGTLVSADGAHGILTAAHVWTKQLHSFDRIALTLKERDFHEFLIDTSFLKAHTVGPSDDEAWGPDICFLRIPTSAVGTIKAFRTFYNLSKRREFALKHEVNSNAGLWVLMGIPATESSFTPVQARLKFFGAISTIESSHQRGDFDYLDLGINLSKNPPPSFGGMSGGGLWQIDIERRQSMDGTWSWSAAGALEGVAFYQSIPADGRRFIRCHGRRSIYSNIPR
jgi:hypothetical protein